MFICEKLLCVHFLNYLNVSGKESDVLKVKRFRLKGSAIRAKDMIFLNSISSKKKSKSSNNNGSRIKCSSSDVI